MFQAASVQINRSFVCWKWCILRFFGNLLETFEFCIAIKKTHPQSIFLKIIHNFLDFRGNSQDTYHWAVQESNLFLCGSEWWFLLRGLSEDETGHSPLWPSKHSNTYWVRWLSKWRGLKRKKLGKVLCFSVTSTYLDRWFVDMFVVPNH